MEPIPIETFFDKSKQQQSSSPPTSAPSKHHKTSSALIDLFANVHFLGFLQHLFIAIVLLMFARQMLHGRSFVAL